MESNYIFVKIYFKLINMRTKEFLYRERKIVKYLLLSKNDFPLILFKKNGCRKEMRKNLNRNKKNIIYNFFVAK